ncbi:hypothetical protein Z951_32910 [Streptomyces sp. PRh5]|nr:hypothetical protein Z951_32910 [Streptomyces sp. PRh5]
MASRLLNTAKRKTEKERLSTMPQLEKASRLVARACSSGATDCSPRSTDASGTSRATRDVARSFMRVVPSPRWTKTSRKPVQKCTSNSRYGRSIFGSIFSTRLRSEARDFGSRG